MQQHADPKATVPKEPNRARSSASGQEAPPSSSDGENQAGKRVPIRDFRRDGWYRIENELLDPEHFPELDVYDIAVYNALAYHVGREEDGCFPSRQTIADHARCSYGKVWDCIEKLCELGLVRKKERTTDSGRQTSHEYHLLSVKDVVREKTPSKADSGDPSQHDGGTRHSMTGDPSQHDDEQKPSKKTQPNKKSPTTAAGAGENFEDGESNQGLTDGLKSHFAWLDDVGDEDKLQAVYRVADRLLTECSASCLEESSTREICAHVIRVAYGNGALNELSDLQQETVLDRLAELYDDGRWSKPGEEWTEPVAACAIASFVGLDLHRVGNVVKGWKKQFQSTSSRGTANGQKYDSSSDSHLGDVSGDGSRRGMPGPPGNKSGQPTNWDTNERGFPADLEATRKWAEAHDFPELLADGLWYACGAYGWTDVMSRPKGRSSGGDSIRNLEAYARAHEKRLMTIENQRRRNQGPSNHTLEDLGKEHLVEGGGGSSVFEDSGGERALAHNS